MMENCFVHYLCLSIMIIGSVAVVLCVHSGMKEVQKKMDFQKYIDQEIVSTVGHFKTLKENGVVFSQDEVDIFMNHLYFLSKEKLRKQLPPKYYNAPLDNEFFYLSVNKMYERIKEQTKDPVLNEVEGNDE